MTTVSFDDVISRLDKVQSYSNYSIAVCVFHADNDPSMMVFKDGWFRCLGCGRVGKWNQIWDKVNGRRVIVTPEPKTSFRPPVLGEGLEETCYQAHLDILQFPSFQWYIEQRGIQDRIETNEIGYWQGWYTFPVRDEEGKFKTAVLRAAPHVQEVSGLRYWCKSVPVPYVPDWRLLNNAKSIFVVYGIMDALTLSSLRFPVITSTAGNNTVNPAWFDNYRVPIHVIPDLGEDDQARELIRHLGWRGNILKLKFPDKKKDVNGFVEANQKEELISQLSRYI